MRDSVGGVWHPILKMEWVPLRGVISTTDESEPADRRFLELLGDMRNRQIGHGDLQHGNLLVVEGRDAGVAQTHRLRRDVGFLR